MGVCQSTSLANAHCTVKSISGRSRGSRNAAVKLYCSRGIHQMMFAVFTSHDLILEMCWWAFLDFSFSPKYKICEKYILGNICASPGFLA